MATQPSTYSISSANLMRDRVRFRPPISVSQKIIGVSSWAREARNAVAYHASHKRVVVLEGEPGVGKKFLARLIHDAGDNPSSAFISLRFDSCTERFDQRVFSNLILASRQLKKAPATIFLEDPDDVSLTRLSELVADNQKTDVRILVGKTADINSLSPSSDLEGLNWERIRIPGLRFRSEDVEPLVSHYLNWICELRGKEVRSITAEAINALRHYDWPRNISELKLLVARLVSQSGPPLIDAAMLPKYLARGLESSEALPEEGVDLAGEVERLELSLIRAALRQCHGRQNAAAQLLRIKPTTLFMKLKRYNIEVEEFKTASSAKPSTLVTYERGLKEAC